MFKKSLSTVCYDTSNIKDIFKFEISFGCYKINPQDTWIGKTGKFYDSKLKCVFYLDCGKLNRIDGPASICLNVLCWYKNGKLNRLNGPAKRYDTGEKFYFINDIPYQEEEFNFLNKEVIKKENNNKIILL